MTSSGPRPVPAPEPVAPGAVPSWLPPGWGGGHDTVIHSSRPASEPAPVESARSERSQICQTLFPPVDGEASPPFELNDIRLGHFRLIRRLGSGGMGSVFLALDERLQRHVALKILSPIQAREPLSVRRFQNEASATARISHDHIANVYYVGEDQGLHFIAFEFVDGLNLRELIRQKRRLAPAEAVHYAIQIASALANLDSAGIVHRDIKPSNILITPRNDAKLIDLGLARQDVADVSDELTVAGTTLGTFDYISPEQAKDPRKADIRSDIYSLGCSMYHMLTGEPPYPQGTVLQKLLDHQGKSSPDPAAKNRAVPRALSLIVRRMMESDPAKRYGSAESLIRDLWLVGQSLGMRPEAESTVLQRFVLLPARSRWTGNSAWIAAALLVLGAAFLLQQNPQWTQLDAGRSEDRRGSVVEGALPPRVPPSRSDVEPSVPPGDAVAAPSPTQAANDAPRRDLAASGDGKSTRAPLEQHPFNDPDLPLLSQGAFPNYAELAGPNNGAGRQPPPLMIAQGERLDAPPEYSPIDPRDAVIVPFAPRATPPVEPPASDAGSPSKAASGLPRVAASQGASAAPNPAASNGPPPISIVGGGGYDWVEAACSEAPNHATIELNYRGRARAAERPIRLNGKHLTIRGAGAQRPVIRFDGSQTDDARFISVGGGSLTLVRVDLELTLPAAKPAVQPFALLSLERPEKVLLQDVRITIVNPRNLPAAVVELVGPPGQMLGSMPLMRTGQTPVAPEVQLRQTFVRGGADLLSLNDVVAARLYLEDSLVAVEQSALRAPARSDASTEGSRTELHVNHSTIAVGGSLLSLSGGDDNAMRAAALQVDAQNSIVAIGAHRSLVELESSSDLIDPRQSVFWQGQRNFYDGLPSFWSVPSRFSGSGAWSFAEWQQTWGGGEAANSKNLAIAWARDWRKIAWHELEPRDFELDASKPDNPPLKGAETGVDAGASPARLPQAGKSIVPPAGSGSATAPTAVEASVPPPIVPAEDVDAN